MSNCFCGLLSNGYSFRLEKSSGDLKVAPCCWFGKTISFDKNIVENHRSQFGSIADWTDYCRQCQLLESAGQQSLRQTTRDWVPLNSNDQTPVMIDINLDYECNAACVICSEHSSSLWEKENQKFKGIPVKNQFTDNLIEKYIQNIVESLPLDHVTYVKFFGGEPLFTNTHIKFLEKLPDPQNVTIHYTTNASIFPSDNVLKIWDKFKTIIFSASLDGIDAQFDYIRWPLPWSKVSRNLKRLRQMRLHNLMFRVEFTANMLNTFYYDRLEDWIKGNLSQNEFGDPTEINIHHCINSAFALEHMPLEIRSMIKEKYPKNHILHSLVDIPYSGTQKPFWDFVKKWDPWRKIRWQDCFPELVSHINDK